MSNYLEILMIIVALLLVVVIWSLSSVLAMMAKKVVEHAKQAKKITMILVIVSSSLFANSALAQDAAADSVAARPLINYGGMSSESFWTMGTVIALELLIVLLLVIFIKGLWKSLHPTIQIAAEKKIADSLDINDPELIKFMNTKMNMVDKTLIDVFYDILIFAFEKGVYTPCKYLYEYFEDFDYTQIISKDFFKQNP